MTGSAKLMTASGGGVLLQPANSIATDVTVKIPTNGDSIVTSLGNAIILNSKTISTSQTIPSGYSGHSAGPITLSNGVTVTLSSGSRWVIL